MFANYFANRLLDKLLVVCPNVDYCEDVLPRCDLESHLLHRCRGAVTRCAKAHLGCTFQGPRSALHSHLLWECAYRTEGEVPLLPPEPDPTGGWSAGKQQQVVSGDVSTIEFGRGRHDLGVSFVGGSDTPLSCIVIQEIYMDGLVAIDGRLRPGDQILEVNGEDVTRASHSEARRLLSQGSQFCRLTVYRERACEPDAQQQQQQQFLQHHHQQQQRRLQLLERDEVFPITLSKRSGKTLGIKLVGKKSFPGLYVLGLVEGGLAQLDGRLRRDDRILEINGVDIRGGTQAEAAEIIQSASDKVSFLVSRRCRPETPDLIRTASGENLASLGLSAGGSASCQHLADAAAAASATTGAPKQQQLPQPQYGTVPPQERTVRLEKSPGESLGMSVAGGSARSAATSRSTSPACAPTGRLDAPCERATCCWLCRTPNCWASRMSRPSAY
ncbi:hypothetical protein BOX15_Mlig001666g1 [Macrostomum lignano]|uniref:PDZ domain-containing protein n=1 Tax=Macrostomum lignano TaxID=282301 RepID=A0A267DDT6_9PLAT|nr:hypothetical protein BOX15_Mlig001666g1 [Macrostomum lignano]